VGIRQDHLNLQRAEGAVIVSKRSKRGILIAGRVKRTHNGILSCTGCHSRPLCLEESKRSEAVREDSPILTGCIVGHPDMAPDHCRLLPVGAGQRKNRSAKQKRVGEVVDPLYLYAGARVCQRPDQDRSVDYYNQE
jgi:hypothetical protein